MNKMELVKEILSDMEYKNIRDGIWTHKSDKYTDFFHHAHADLLPDDYRYRMIHDLLCNMEEYSDEMELIDSLVPIYTYDLMAWISSSNTRYTYCDEFKDEYGISDEKSIIDLISGGYMMELMEVLNLINEWLDENTDEEAD